MLIVTPQEAIQLTKMWDSCLLLKIPFYSLTAQYYGLTRLLLLVGIIINPSLSHTNSAPYSGLVKNSELRTQIFSFEGLMLIFYVAVKKKKNGEEGAKCMGNSWFFTAALFLRWVFHFMLLLLY